MGKKLVNKGLGTFITSTPVKNATPKIGSAPKPASTIPGTPSGNVKGPSENTGRVT